METTTLYRLIHPSSNTGPWGTYLSSSEGDKIEEARDILNEHFNTAQMFRKHPNAWEDIPAFDPGITVCATRTLDMLRTWFAFSDEIVNALADAGYTVMEYTVPQDTVLNSRSGTQVAFRPSSIVAERDLSILALID